MEIKTRFNLDEEVLYLKENFLNKGKINNIKIIIKQDNYNIHINEINIYYRIDIDIYVDYIHEDLIFKSKEEYIKYINNLEL